MLPLFAFLFFQLPQFLKRETFASTNTHFRHLSAWPWAPIASIFSSPALPVVSSAPTSTSGAVSRRPTPPPRSSPPDVGPQAEVIRPSSTSGALSRRPASDLKAATSDALSRRPPPTEAYGTKLRRLRNGLRPNQGCSSTEISVAFCLVWISLIFTKGE